MANSISSFFIFCSGASKEALEKCLESELKKYIALGSLILFVAAVASLGEYNKAIERVLKSRFIYRS